MAVMKIQKTPSIRRMPTYLHKLVEMQMEGVPFVSTTQLADYMNLEPIVVRKDIGITGISGQPGIGYKTDKLIAAIRRFLGWDSVIEACLVGAGSLGSALLGYDGFENYGLKISTAFDRDTAKIGSYIHGREIFDYKQLPELVAQLGLKLGIICVPAPCAQAVADQLTDCGIKAIWNFANVSLKLPEDVVVQREVIAGGLALLSVKLGQQNSLINAEEKNGN
ncbi:MAG: redox-sensing transcriptional repressor Rex [Victivallaceae bacterium]|jgi:redox-sensing transcriptional repressor|nr:redox-sensing transcriptional repressor Rex [Victivallaceae bacterium]NLK82681.1 redox-sensing transcriptional repressor Rex [Lentisphaerota bacterium]MDD3115930.1 redox-sensing transcriptional repressor Rex [Victivallaceae bacterium]MDD3703508.1 redox-sensing transcriptional repressor Rex [Victivallaceae bacterium]MDD4317123.1 redox-sensing transcriptional repressor Rex [Victivallaceae bacterium]